MSLRPSWPHLDPQQSLQPSFLDIQLKQTSSVIGRILTQQPVNLPYLCIFSYYSSFSMNIFTVLRCLGPFWPHVWPCLRLNNRFNLFLDIQLNHTSSIIGQILTQQPMNSPHLSTVRRYLGPFRRHLWPCPRLNNRFNLFEHPIKPHLCIDTTTIPQLIPKRTHPSM